MYNTVIYVLDATNWWIFWAQNTYSEFSSNSSCNQFNTRLCKLSLVTDKY